MADQTLIALAAEADRTRANLCGAAQIAVWYFEAQQFEETYNVLKRAVDNHNTASRALFEYQQNSPVSPSQVSSPDLPSSVTQGETSHGNRAA